MPFPPDVRVCTRTVFLVLLISYAMLGIRLFGHVAWGEYLNADAHFGNFSMAVSTMFRCATGEEWSNIMRDAMRRQAGCEEDGSCGTCLAVPYFVSFVLLSSCVVLKMMVAVVLGAFSHLLDVGEGLPPWVGHAFAAAWGEQDPDATGRISLPHLPALVRALPPPLGLDPAVFAQRAVRDSDVTRFILRLAEHSGLEVHHTQEALQQAAEARAASGLRMHSLSETPRGASSDEVDTAQSGPQLLFHEVLSAMVDAAFHKHRVMDWDRHAATAAGHSTAHAHNRSHNEKLRKRLTMQARETSHRTQSDLLGLAYEAASSSLRDEYAAWVLQRCAKKKAWERTTQLGLDRAEMAQNTISPSTPASRSGSGSGRWPELRRKREERLSSTPPAESNSSPKELRKSWAERKAEAEERREQKGGGTEMSVLLQQVEGYADEQLRLGSLARRHSRDASMKQLLDGAKPPTRTVPFSARSEDAHFYSA